jgi:hypothetical protein
MLKDLYGKTNTTFSPKMLRELSQRVSKNHLCLSHASSPKLSLPNPYFPEPSLTNSSPRVDEVLCIGPTQVVEQASTLLAIFKLN